MTASTNPVRSEENRHKLKAGAAFRLAWIAYAALLMIPFLLFLAVVMTLNSREGLGVQPAVRNGWFIGLILYLLIAGPASFVVRSRLFRSYWHGVGVSPRHYLMGMLVVWLTFEVGGIISLFGCMITNSLVPNLLPALAAFMFFVFLWPNGSAMARPTGNSDDPEIYREPG